MVPLAAGGEDHETNMVTACEDCNRGKSCVPLTSIPASIEEQRIEREDRIEQLRAYNQFLLDLRNEEDKQIEELGRRWHQLIDGERGRHWVFGPSRIPSIRTFLKRMPMVDVLDAMEIALSRIGATLTSDYSAWKYFCGVCWRRIKERDGNDG
jgi:hypothetical protein